MTLIVSARVPDGIVVAADSLASLRAQTDITAKGKTVCPSCGKEHEFEAPIRVPSGIGGVTSTLPFSQKLVPLLNKYAVGLFGSTHIGDRTVFSFLRAFDRGAHDYSAKPMMEVASALAQKLHGSLSSAVDVSTIPEGATVVGFQMNGYQDDRALTIVCKIGREITEPKHYAGDGVTVDGDIRVVTKLWELTEINPELSSFYTAWSVQDAIDYATFLISTTARYQRFANMIPNVGGDIDIAFVGPPGTFRWVKRKALSELLLGEE